MQYFQFACQTLSVFRVQKLSKVLLVKCHKFISNLSKFVAKLVTVIGHFSQQFAISKLLILGLCNQQYDCAKSC